MDKKTIGIIICSLLAGLPILIKIWNVLYYKYYILGMAINRWDKQGKTWLIKAVENGDINFIDVLLKKGALVDQKDTYGRTALMYAFIKGKTEIINNLLTNKASINMTDNKNETILLWYLTEGQKDMVKNLINMGADPSVGGIDEKSPIKIAAEKGYTELVELFLEKGARLSGMFAKKDLNYNNLITIYNKEYYNGQSDDIDTLLRHLKEKGDYDNLKRFFLETSKDDGDTRLAIIGFSYNPNKLFYDNDVINVIKNDFKAPYRYSISKKIDFLEKHPEIFKAELNKMEIESIFTKIHTDSMFRPTPMSSFLKALKLCGYDVLYKEKICDRCGGLGKIYIIKPLDNDSYDYLCGCYDGKLVKVEVKSGEESVYIFNPYQL